MVTFPLVEELPFFIPPQQVFELLKDNPCCFFLDSGMDPEKLGRYSFIGSDPYLLLKSSGKTVTQIRGTEKKVYQGNPFDILGELLARYPLEKTPCPVPFVGGAVGYFSYDLCHFIERLPAKARDDLQLPECNVAFYDAVIAFDLLAGKAYVVSTGFPENGMERERRAERRASELKEVVYKALYAQPSDNALPKPVVDEMRLKSNFSREGYLAAVRKVREYIIAGDIFQVNLSQRFEADLAIQPYDLCRRLRAINPAPFAAYLGFDDVQVISASPERFLRLDGDLVETRPIKGTRPRGKTPADDQELARELLSSIKDRAENIMIVDLERNDIGRVCQYGTVRVTETAILETYPTVFHLTSTVVGRLRPGNNRIDLLKASYPGGSITGAPKVRAMEIIDELEPTRRSVYTGAIGYLGFNGDMDLNIVIRTILVKKNKAYFQVGGGIVYDSDPESEYTETLDKAKALIQALGISSKVQVELK